MLHTVTIEAAPADLSGAYGGQLGWRIWRLSGETREAIPFGAFAGDAPLEATVILEPGTYEIAAGRRGVGRVGSFLLDGDSALVVAGGDWLVVSIEEPTVLVRSPEQAPARTAAPPKPAAKPDLPPQPEPAIKLDPTTAIMLDSSVTFGVDGHRVWIALTRDALRPVLAQLRAEDRRYRTYDRTVTAKGISVPVVVLIDVTSW